MVKDGTIRMLAQIQPLLDIGVPPRRGRSWALANGAQSYPSSLSSRGRAIRAFLLLSVRRWICLACDALFATIEGTGFVIDLLEDGRVVPSRCGRGF